MATNQLDLSPKRGVDLYPKRGQIQNGDMHRFCMSPPSWLLLFWLQVNTAFWISFVYKSNWYVAVFTCCRLGFITVWVVSETASRQNGNVLVVAVLDLALC